MNTDQFNREFAYQTTMNLVSKMLEASLITEAEFKIANSLMVAKYQPVIGSLAARTP